jgi:hypothetical protein
MTSFKMIGAGPSVLARLRDAAEGRGPAEGNARLLRDFLSDLRAEVGHIKSECFCGVSPVVGASLAKLADYSSQLDDFFDQVGKDPRLHARARGQAAGAATEEPPPRCPNRQGRHCQSWLGEFGQGDRWRFCLTAAGMARAQERR